MRSNDRATWRWLGVDAVAKPFDPLTQRQFSATEVELERVSKDTTCVVAERLSLRFREAQEAVGKFKGHQGQLSGPLRFRNQLEQFASLVVIALAVVILGQAVAGDVCLGKVGEALGDDAVTPRSLGVQAIAFGRRPGVGGQERGVLRLAEVDLRRQGAPWIALEEAGCQLV